MSDTQTHTKWYHDGLRFECTQCGNCCSGAPGFVWVNEHEQQQMADQLGYDLPAFRRRYLRRVGRRYSLIELKNGDCVFLRRDPQGKAICAVYENRPTQCRTWPFWKSNLNSPRSWDLAGDDCPGINQGIHHPLPVIQAQLDANGDLPL